MASKHIALCLDRSGVPNLESDLALEIFAAAESNNNNISSRYFLQSYFDANSLVVACNVTGRDALTEMGLRFNTGNEQSEAISKAATSSSSHSSSPIRQKHVHVLVPRSPFAATCNTGYPSADIGPCSDQLQGRVTMSVDKWFETVSTTKPEFSAPVCDLVSIPEIMSTQFASGTRKRQTFSTRNQLWLSQIIDKYNTAFATACATAPHLPCLVFPLGTHFEQKKKVGESNGNNNTSGEDDAATAAVAAADNNNTSTTTTTTTVAAAAAAAAGGVTVDIALYTKWATLCLLQKGKEHAAGNEATTRFVSLLSLGCGETRAERRAFLFELCAALQAAEAVFQTQQQQQPNTSFSSSSSFPLSFIIGNIGDRETMCDVEEILLPVFLSSNQHHQQHVVYSGAYVPQTMSSRGLALQRFAGLADSTASSNSSSSQQQNSFATQLQQREAEENNQESVRRQRDGANDDNATDDDEATTTTSKRAQKYDPSCTPIAADFNVINLWDPVHKFSRLPLSGVQSAKQQQQQQQIALKDCRCMACQRHSSGYIHHLLDVHEMNADILLTLHNWTQWIDYLR